MKPDLKMGLDMQEIYWEKHLWRGKSQSQRRRHLSNRHGGLSLGQEWERRKEGGVTSYPAWFLEGFDQANRKSFSDSHAELGDGITQVVPGLAPLWCSGSNWKPPTGSMAQQLGPWWNTSLQ